MHVILQARWEISARSAKWRIGGLCACKAVYNEKESSLDTSNAITQEDANVRCWNLGHVTPSLGGHVRTSMRPYIDRSFFRSTLEAIQLSVLHHICTLGGPRT